MIDILRLTKTIADWQKFIQHEPSHSSLSRISQKISRLKKEIDLGFPEFGDLQETIAIYNLYQELEMLQQQINYRKE